MSLDGCRIDQDLLDAQVCELRLIDVRLVIQRDAEPINNLVPPLFLDGRANQSGLIPMDIVLAQNLLDRLDTGLDCRLIVGRAVLAEQVLQHICRDNGIALDGLDQVLAHCQAGKVLVDLDVQIGHKVWCWRACSFFGHIGSFRNRSRW